MAQEPLGRALLEAVKPNRTAPASRDPVAWLARAIAILETPQVVASVPNKDDVGAVVLGLRTLHDRLRAALDSHLSADRKASITSAVTEVLRVRYGRALSQVFVHADAALNREDGDVPVMVSFATGAVGAEELARVQRLVERRLEEEGEHAAVKLIDLDPIVAFGNGVRSAPHVEAPQANDGEDESLSMAAL